MLDTIEIEITDYKSGSAHIFKLDTELQLKQCTLTKRYEAKLVTDSGITEITKPLVTGNFVAIIYKETRFSYRIVFLPSDIREDIVIK